MAQSNFSQESFLAGEWSPFAQGKISDPNYRRAMNVCRNGFPLEEGNWIRRSGTRFAATTRNGVPGRVIPFAFEQASPYIMEFTDGFLRFYAVSTQTVGLTTPLPSDFRLVTTNDNQQVLNVSSANPAVVQTASAHGWTTGDQGQFLFASTVNTGFTPLLRARTFKITVTDSTHFSISDPISSAAIDGSTLGWSAPVAGTVIFVRNVALATPYTGGLWSSVRKVQAETQAILLQTATVPQNLQVSKLPTASTFAAFMLSNVSFLDGPYLDPPTDGSWLTPTITPVSQGALPSGAAWTDLVWNGTVFCAIASGGTTAATSTDGLAWTVRTLPTSANWAAIAWNGSVFCAIASGSTAAATSPDGITWTARTLPASALWSGIAWNGSVFAIVGDGANGATSPDGTTWTSRTMPNVDPNETWVDVAWNGSTLFCAIGNESGRSLNQAATSPTGTTWTQTADFQPPGQTSQTSGIWSSLAWNGTVFCAVSGTSAYSYTSPDGINWSKNKMPDGAWVDVAWNGSIFCAVGSGNTAATSADGVTWQTQSMPTSAAWSAIATHGTTFVAIASLSTATAVTTFASFSLTASSTSSINGGAGFQNTDVGRLIRLLSEPTTWFVATAYVAGNAVKFNGAYFVAIASTTGDQPDIAPTKWAISTAAATWTWGTISAVASTSKVSFSVAGPPILYPTNPIFVWRLGVYSATTGYPTCGTYYQGRMWLSGAVSNRVDASVTNEISNGVFNFAPTAQDGTVADNNAISYTFNSDDVNPVFWMIGRNEGIVCGTQAGEWLIAAPTSGPITPTNITAHQGTHYGSANVEPEATQLTLSFVQRFNRKLLEYFPDALSGRFVAPNLAENAKHLTAPGISEIRFQQELSPVLWARLANGALVGDTYDRESLFSSQPSKFNGWHRHDLGSGRTIESIAVGPSTDGTLDTLAMVTNDAATNIRHVELMQQIFDVNAAITSGWLLDDAVTPSGATLTSAGVSSTLTLKGLWHLNGKTVTVSCGGVDVGDFIVTNGSAVVPIDNQVNTLFTTAYLQSISSTTAYGAIGMPIDGKLGRLTVPCVVGFTYTSQGQILRPDTQDQGKSPAGPGLAKPRRIAQFGALLAGTQGISFGTTFANLHPAAFKSAGGTQDLTALQLFTGVYWQTVDDNWGFDSMLCWQINRPYPGALISLNGFMQSTDR